MGRRFYCEFCDKSFPANLENRRKHNEGAQHQRLRNAYYSQFKGKARKYLNFISS
jgi:U11/U12 small nuclear ribonucleoprotein SNRNP20